MQQLLWIVAVLGAGCGAVALFVSAPPVVAIALAVVPYILARSWEGLARAQNERRREIAAINGEG